MIDEKQVGTTARFKFGVSLYRIMFDNLFSFILKVTILKQTTCITGTFAILSAVLTGIMLVINSITVIYGFLTWRSDMLNQMKAYLPSIMEDILKFKVEKNATDKESTRTVTAYGNIVDTIAPDTLQIVRDSINDHYPFINKFVLLKKPNKEIYIIEDPSKWASFYESIREEQKLKNYRVDEIAIGLKE